MNINETFKYISEKSIYTNKLMNNNEFLVHEANKINKDILENIYSLDISPKDGVIVKFRKEFINLLLNKNISLEELKNLYKKSVEENPKKFNSWKNFYKILHPIFLEPFKNDIDDNITKLKRYLYNILNLNEDNIKINISDFKGSQNFGDEKIWIALYNSTQHSQSTSNQFFFEVHKDKITYGFYKHSNKKNKYITEKIVQSIDEYNENKLLSYFNNNKHLIIDDLFTNDFFSFLQDFNKEDLDNYFSLLKELLKSESIKIYDERIAFYFGENYLCFYVRKKSFFTLYKSGTYHIISKDKFVDGAEILNSTKTKSYTNKTNIFSLIKENKNSIFEQFKIEYELNEKSNRRKMNNEDFEEYVFSLISNNDRKFYKFAPGSNAKFWEEFYNNEIVAVGYNELDIKNLEDIKSYEELQNNYPDQKNSNQLWNIWLLKDAKVNDIVFANKGRNEVIGIGIFEEGKYFYNPIHEYHHQRKINWITNKYLDFKDIIDTKALFRPDTFSPTLNHELIISKYLEEYPELKDTFINYNLIKSDKKIMQKDNYICSDIPKNQILYGPPGTGKTYNTVRLAVQILNNSKELPDYDNAILDFNRYKKEGRLSFITFHQNFSYEDFIQGLRPDPNSEEGMKFIKSDGIFKEIANRAENNIKESFKKPEELSERDSFINALEELKDRVTTNDEDVKISESAYLYSVEEDAFRYTGKNWTLNDKGFNGFRMRYNDLIEIYDNKVNERKQIKELNNISGLAKQHATYFYNTYKILLDEMKPNSIDLNIVKKQSYILIIDEINRANISRVFGELITLIEEDKRWSGNPDKVNWQVTLPSGDPFVIPDNLYIIGTMNTADKSIALLDVALRRRFNFKAMYPLYEIEGVKYMYSDYLKKLNGLIVEKLGAVRGHDLQIGHSYFMKINNNEEFIATMNDKVIPLLMEYFMNNIEEDKELVLKSLKGYKFSVIKESYPLEIIENLNDEIIQENVDSDE